MSPSTSLAAVAVASLVRGGARKPPPPPPETDLYETFFKLNEPLRFFISGNIGNVIFFYIERLTFSFCKRSNNLPAFVKEYMDSVSFFFAYVLQVIPQHWLHAYLVYGMDTIDTRQKYFTTLLGCYSAYMSSLIGSTFLNMFFVKTLGIDKTVSFVLTLWTFAVINYFFISWIVGMQRQDVAPKAVQDARQAAKQAQQAIAQAKKKEQAKAKLVEAKMKERAQQAKLKAMALEEKMKAKAEMDKQKAKEKIQKEKERAKQQAEREKENAKKQKQPKIKEVGNKAVRTRGGGNARSSKQARGGGGGIPVRFHTTLASKDKLHSFVLSVGKGVEIHDE
mmetsp:Transcript_15154/g.27381  ORF Transcript_15154/g.27381 Transcript_15154/m.27381 type:complete len:336 (+) Transcript_15154:62-1069(+)